MPILMPATHDLRMVALSFFIAWAGAFVALTATDQMHRVRGRARALNLAAAAVALGGIGVWSMHFTGMLSLRLGMGVSYSLPETLASLLAAVSASGVALWAVAERPTAARLFAAGTGLGLAVCAMHYLGMGGMRVPGYVDWSPALVATSVAIAIAAATAGLWLALAVRGTVARAAAGLVIAGAVCAMHYTGMAAAQFFCTSPEPGAFPRGAWLITSLDLPGLVACLSLGMAAVIGLDQAFQRWTHAVAPVRAAVPRQAPARAR